MTIEIKSIDAIAKCDICGCETPLEIDNYSRTMSSYTGNRIQPSMWLKHDDMSAWFSIRLFRHSIKRETRLMVCQNCCKKIDQLEKQIDNDRTDRIDNILKTMWESTGFKPPENDPYFE